MPSPAEIEDLPTLRAHLCATPAASTLHHALTRSSARSRVDRRQLTGVYILALLCPVQTALFRAARDGTLATKATRALNLVTGVAIGALVLDGRNQVDAGSRAFATLAANDPLRALVESGDGGRVSANTTAAFTVGFVVALVYLYQAAFRSSEQRA